MSTATPTMSADQKRDVTDTLNTLSDGLAQWTEKVRPEDGAPGRLRWAVASTRDANVGATRYVLNGLERAGLKDRLWTEEDQQAAIAWIRSLHTGGEQYHDPALFDRPSPDWPADQPWPSDAMRATVNGYAQDVLEHCGVARGAMAPAEPPPGWPQKHDDPAAMLQWIKTRPYDQRAWGACSHGMRMTRFMLDWYKQGVLSLDPVVEAIDFFYSIQDPETGLWGTSDQPRNVRINGAFKLFVLLREQLDLPLPHADRLIDQVLAEFDRPDYERTVGGCDEWDNLYVLAMARDQAERDRSEELRALAARRLSRIPELFGKPDGGLSFVPEHGKTDWLGIDMAPERPQGDAMGLCIVTCAINQCIDLLGLHEATRWTGDGRTGGPPEPEDLRRAIGERLRAVDASGRSH